MMDLAAIGQLAAESDSLEAPFVKGRVLQLDADFGCYECAWLDKTLNENIVQLKNLIETCRLTAGAEFVNVHITLGMKGGRTQMATVKPYQEKRNANKDPEKQARVAALRNFLANYKTDIAEPVSNLLQEADDSLTIMQRVRITTHGLQSSVIMSGDKDLWMSEGLHCEQKTGRIYEVKGYGKTVWKDVGNVKPKLVGEGTSWFWHQLLHGDGADNIAGLPELSGKLLNRYLPTKKTNPKRPAQSCGEAKSFAVLKGVTSDRDACTRVFEAYRGHWPNATEMLVEQAFLLWMRRTDRVDDVLEFLNASGLMCEFSPAQKERLREFKRLAVIQIQASEQ
jgi:DNA polymerase-1